MFFGKCWRAAQAGENLRPPTDTTRNAFRASNSRGFVVMARARVIVQNVLSNWLALAVTTVVGFFLSPFVVHRLGNLAYGVWVIIGSLVSYMGLLDLGLRGAVT